MALNAYLHLKGQKQGEIKGSVIQKGRENKIQVIAVSHDLSSPKDAVTGLATGKRIHKPFVIIKELDKSSPLLYIALCNNELITEFELQFWMPQKGATVGVGSEKQHYTIRLTNASILDIKFRMPNNKNPELANLAEYEEVSFTYQKIEWTWKDGSITAEDEWLKSNI
ncbi:type VI secretion system effector [Chryseobacterium sp. Leaf404]|uniref:Hcp family type VI secretion system effector n=1 Tax=unclassified Chryseobacterium TaxID=2593645 RepID=UPI00070134ED|nr:MULTISPECIES: Hcp family type VI secretion system effector [unclassified Chryseobacterium]KQT15495.1 type VI secretion system effector [Chryseobacterium sp. Leaf404]